MAYTDTLKQGFETPDGKRVNVESAFKNPQHPFRGEGREGQLHNGSLLVAMAPNIKNKSALYFSIIVVLHNKEK